nr:hypothetical protein [Escherichia coli]WKV17299.1 hypothetical protein pHN08160-1_00114 [Shigella sonnei]WKV17478.1 hypothetical protein pSH12sh288-1_00091 [Shigella sonnei]
MPSTKRFRHTASSARRYSNRFPVRHNPFHATTYFVSGTEIKPESDYVCTHLFSGLQASCYFLKCKIIKNKDTS